jgi:hypothetical protein
MMRKYKENEDNREKFFDERTKGQKSGAGAPKQVFGGEGSASETFGNMFSGSGDLAVQRKIEKASVTIEKVTDDSNSVVEPESK